MFAPRGQPITWSPPNHNNNNNNNYIDNNNDKKAEKQAMFMATHLKPAQAARKASSDLTFPAQDDLETDSKLSWYIDWISNGVVIKRRLGWM